MSLTPRLPRLLALCAAASLTPVFAALVEFTGHAEIVGVSGPAPAYIYADWDRATHLSVTGVFDTAQPATGTTANSATYTAIYAVGTVDGVEVPLVHATLTLRQDSEFESYDYLLMGVAADGRIFTLFGYSPDAGFVPSLDLPAQGVPQGDWYEKWDIDLIGANWEWSCYTDGAGFSSGPLDEPKTSTVPPPSIQRHPQAQVSVKSGAANFRVKAQSEAEAPRYQWFKDGQALPGATNPYLHLRKVGPADAGAYHVVVSNSGGETVSRAAALRVLRL
jgi:hypothetical protein